MIVLLRFLDHSEVAHSGGKGELELHFCKDLFLHEQQLLLSIGVGRVL